MKRYSEQEIRDTMRRHHPVGEIQYEENGAEAFCECGQTLGIWEDPPRCGYLYIPFTGDHFLEALAANRLEKK